MSMLLAWQGADNGREGLLRADKWFKTLSLLAKHEGTSITDYSSILYRDLFKEMPEESWLGKAGDRSLFRDYQKCWTSLGVMFPTQDTNQVIEITKKGKELVESGNVAEFFRLAIDDYVEPWDVDGRVVLVSPYEHIAHALMMFVGKPTEVSVAELQKKAEVLASVSVSKNKILPFVDSDTNKRRFRSYLTIFENAEVLAKTRGGYIENIDWDYLGSIVRSGLLAIERDSLVASFDWSGGDASLPADITEDLRERKLAYRVVREGQESFSKIVGKAYSYTCCVTGTKEQSVLQAAHIVDYRGRQTNFPSNGLLMASDAHTLFDRGRLLINPTTLQIEDNGVPLDSRYAQYVGKTIAIPSANIYQPSKEALTRKYHLFKSA